MTKVPGAVFTSILLGFTCLSLSGGVALAKPVNLAHPRLLLTAADKARLLAKKNANDPSWLALKARADTLATYSINPYKFTTSASSPPNTIFYTYQSEGWFDAALPLAFTYQMTSDTQVLEQTDATGAGDDSSAERS